ncbi:MAG: class I SAM-dependent methyltransferase [Candidatus Goldiibacteriota bacterium]
MPHNNNNMDRQRKYAEMFGKGDLLELGCGRGDFMKICEEKGIKATGVDLTPGITADNIVEADILQYLEEAKESSFEGVYARHIIEHFSPRDLRRLIKGIKRVLKKEGKAVFITPDIRSLNVALYDFWNDPDHIRPYTADAVFKLCAEQGLEPVEAGSDRDTVKNDPLRFFVRKARYIFSGIKSYAPDLYIIVKK